MSARSMLSLIWTVAALVVCFAPSQASAQTVISEDFANGIPETWTAACTNVEAFGESCTASDGAPGVSFTANASCTSTPFNGAQSRISSTFDLPPGQYEVRGEGALMATHYSFCSGASGGLIAVTANNTQLGFENCAAPGCTSCTLPSGTTAIGCTSHRGGSIQLGLAGIAGDCGRVSGTLTGFEVVDITQPIVPVWPEDVAVTCGGSTDPMDTGVATGTNACGAVPATFEDAFTATCPVILQRTWLLDDGADQATHTQLITITDEQAPELDGAAIDTCGVGNADERCITDFAAQIGITDCDPSATVIDATCTITAADSENAETLGCTYDPELHTLCFDSTLPEGAISARVEVNAVIADVCGNTSTRLAHTLTLGADDTDGDDLGDVCDDDDDDDNLLDTEDNCPLIANEDQLDTDSDDLGDACDDIDDRDDDSDGILNTEDNCPTDANADQLDTDSDAIGDACDDDVDGDSIPNAEDNCPLIANADQANLDGDDQGDVCDDSDDRADDDSDGIPNTEDNCPADANADQLDTDGDGVGDACTDPVASNNNPGNNPGNNNTNNNSNNGDIFNNNTTGSASGDSEKVEGCDCAVVSPSATPSPLAALLVLGGGLLLLQRRRR